VTDRAVALSGIVDDVPSVRIFGTAPDNFSRRAGLLRRASLSPAVEQELGKCSFMGILGIGNFMEYPHERDMSSNVKALTYPGTLIHAKVPGSGATMANTLLLQSEAASDKALLAFSNLTASPTR
jgi:hypothetical protein